MINNAKSLQWLDFNGYNHYIVYHSHNEFASGKNHLNVIENCRSVAKKIMRKFNGMFDDKFILHLKESDQRSAAQIKLNLTKLFAI